MIFNPLDKFFKSETGAVPVGSTVTFRVKCNFDSVTFIIRRDDSLQESYYEMQKDGDVFSVDILCNKSGLFWYKFGVYGQGYIGLDKNYNGVLTDYPADFQLTVFDKDYVVPEWLKGGIIYQILPDRFNRVGDIPQVGGDRVIHKDLNDLPIFEPDEFGEVKNNDFFGGNLQGIIAKLPYLSDLGVTAIYLNPIFKAYSNHRYDTGDYLQIDELLGNETDLVELIRVADEYGIKIILDGVFNHTGSDSVYFNKSGNYDGLGAYQSKDSEYYGWYNFIEYPDLYESWWGIKTLPSTNKGDSGFTEFIAGKGGVIEHYTKLGIGGWRLDVVDELPSEFVVKIRKAVKNADKNAVIIGEVWEDASNKIAYGIRRKYFQGQELDSVMNYPLKNAIISFVKSGKAEVLAEVVREQIDHYPKQVLNSLMNIVSTHDTFRLISAVSDVNVNGLSKQQMSKIELSEEELENAVRRAKLCVLLQYTLCGVPSVYYGDEIGMQGFKDPLNRAYFSWDKRRQDVLDFYKKLGKIRREYSAFIDGEFKEEFVGEYAYAFKRTNEKCELSVLVNAGKKSVKMRFDGTLKELISGKSYDGCCEIMPCSGGIFICEK